MLFRSRVFQIFGRETDATLDALYRDVEAQFQDFYRIVNRDDEAAFEAQLTPSLGKLGFSVDFYGRGFFPPGAYHSEGHQDAMGLCLYLALMKHLLGTGFTFAVLDDVLMSVDAGHRREVCDLLKQVFPNTQFVLTTHDPIWLRHMISAGLVQRNAAIEFRKWDVDRGPAEWKTADVWAEIKDHMSRNDIRASAALLRFHLEHMSTELCDALGGRPVFRADSRYDLGDLLPSAAGAMRELLKVGKAAANSWGRRSEIDAITHLEDAFARAYASAQVEQWSVNPAVHYNAWTNFQRGDFLPVSQAFKALEQAFSCES